MTLLGSLDLIIYGLEVGKVGHRSLSHLRMCLPWLYVVSIIVKFFSVVYTGLRWLRMLVKVGFLC